MTIPGKNSFVMHRNGLHRSQRPNIKYNRSVWEWRHCATHPGYAFFASNICYVATACSASTENFRVLGDFCLHLDVRFSVNANCADGQHSQGDWCKQLSNSFSNLVLQLNEATHLLVISGKARSSIIAWNILWRWILKKINWDNVNRATSSSFLIFECLHSHLWSHSIQNSWS